MKKMLLAGMMVLALTGCATGQSTMKQIDVATAKAAAVDAAGLTMQDAVFKKAELGEREGLSYYEVEFEVDGKEYDYDVDALTGKIIQYEAPKSETSAETPETAPVTPETAPVTPETKAPSETEIGEEKAKALAIAHAKVDAAKAIFLKCYLDRDDGRLVYEIEFYTQDYMEYDYEVDAVTGKILSYDVEPQTAEYERKPEPKPTEAVTEAPAETGKETKKISAEQAKKIALAQVPGATEKEIRGFEVDRDDGRLEYEGSIYYDGLEYEFEIDGYSGAIRSWEVEPIRD